MNFINIKIIVGLYKKIYIKKNKGLSRLFLVVFLLLELINYVCVVKKFI